MYVLLLLLIFYYGIDVVSKYKNQIYGAILIDHTSVFV